MEIQTKQGRTPIRGFPVVCGPKLRAEFLAATVVCAALVSITARRADGDAPGRNAAAPGAAAGVIPNPADVCGTEHPDVFFDRFQAAIARGEIPDPSANALRPVKPGRPLEAGGGTNSLTRKDLFLYEDTDGLLLSNFSNNNLFIFMGHASAALIDEWGDNFDYVAFFLNFEPNHTIGSAFYLGLFNNTIGLGLDSFDFRFAFGVPGDQVQGWVMMWTVNHWTPGAGPGANFTRQVLGQEFEHRWGMYLNPISGGRSLQGDDGDCGRSGHWNFKVDGQGSGMEISEWTGTNPATRLSGALHFNSDIGGVFSPSDLYLMGYLSPAEMDARNSQLRYMDNSTTCSGNYSGPIFGFSSIRIVQTSGTRVPSSAGSQKDFRVGWIMIHQPGNLPTNNDLDRAKSIMEQQQLDWYNGTLGRGTLNASLRRILGGDFDKDGDVDLEDYTEFDNCLSGSGVTDIGPGCDVFDGDQDGDVDLGDYAKFMRAFDGNCGVSITTQPADRMVCVNQPAMFSVQADGVTAYQWTRNGVPINGATGPTFSVNSTTAAAVGEYRVSVFGQCHIAFSTIAHLDMFPPPEFTVQPESVGVCDGGSAQLSVEVSGQAPFGYQWQFNGTNIPGATSPTLMMSDITTDDLGLYRCKVTDHCGLISISNEAEMNFAQDVMVISDPSGATLCEGEVIGLFATVNVPAALQWTKDGRPVAGATSSFLLIPNVTMDDSGAYQLEATGPCSFDASADAVIDVIHCGQTP